MNRTERYVIPTRPGICWTRVAVWFGGPIASVALIAWIVSKVTA